MLIFTGCDRPEPFPLTGFALHEVRDAASPDTMAKTLEGETLHLVKSPLVADPMATSISVVNDLSGPVVQLTLVDKQGLHDFVEV